MRSLLALTLIALLGLTACSSSPAPHRRRAAKPAPEKTVLQEPPLASPQEPAPRPETLAPRPASQETRMLLPTWINPGDGAQMVLVDVPPALTQEANLSQGTLNPLDPAKDPPGTPVFYIDRTEVTVEQFKKFDSKYDPTPFTGQEGCPSCPAMGVDWPQADRYCTLAGKRLPTEAEWEAAARGPTHQPLPWGDRFQPRRANLLGDEDGFPAVAPAGSFPSGAGPYGALDMIGNVWEWVGTPHSPLPVPPNGKANPTLHIAKGGGWTTSPEGISIALRNVVDGRMKSPTFGFRCVKSVE